MEERYPLSHERMNLMGNIVQIFQRHRLKRQMTLANGNNGQNHPEDDHGFGNFNDFFNQFTNGQNGANGGNHGNNGNNSYQPKNKKPLIFYYFIALLFILLLNTFVFPSLLTRSIRQTSYTEFMNAVNNQAITKVNLSDDTITYVATVNGEDLTCQTGRLKNEYTEAQVLQELYRQGVNFDETIPVETSPLLNFLLTWIFPILLFWALGNWLSKRMASSLGAGGGFGGMGGFGKSNAREYEAKDGNKVTFKDVAGEDEAKELLSELVESMKETD